MEVTKTEKRTNFVKNAAITASVGIGVLGALVAYKLGYKACSMTLECGMAKMFKHNPELEKMYYDTYYSMMKK